MKQLIKLILGFLISTLIFSCNKNVPLDTDISSDMKLNINQLELNNRLKTVIFDSVRIEEYSGNIYDSCSKENIIYSGFETYSIKEINIQTEYYLLYQIDFTHLMGVGELSGKIYAGRGRIKSSVKMLSKFAFIDSTASGDSIYINYKTVAKDSYRLKFTCLSDNSEIVFTQCNIYKELNGEVVLDNTGNPLIVSCKLN